MTELHSAYGIAKPSRIIAEVPTSGVIAERANRTGHADPVYLIPTHARDLIAGDVLELGNGHFAEIAEPGTEGDLVVLVFILPATGWAAIPASAQLTVQRVSQ